MTKEQLKQLKKQTKVNNVEVIREVKHDLTYAKVMSKYLWHKHSDWALPMFFILMTLFLVYWDKVLRDNDA